MVSLGELIYHGFDPFSPMVYKYFTMYILYVLSYYVCYQVQKYIGVK